VYHTRLLVRGSPTRLSTKGQQIYKGWSCRLRTGWSENRGSISNGTKIFLFSASCKPTPIQSTPAVSPNVCSRPISHLCHLHLLAKVKQRWSYTCFPLTPFCVHSGSRTPVPVLVTSFLPSCSLTQQKLTQVPVCVTVLLFLERTWWLVLRVPEEIRECIWSVEDASWAPLRLQATKCAAGILQRIRTLLQSASCAYLMCTL